MVEDVVLPSDPVPKLTETEVSFVEVAFVVDADPEAMVKVEDVE